MTADGILNVNKPPGWTSFDVVAFVRRGVGQKRVGHAGTLDPFATGVLPVCLGQATRVVEYLMDARKAYRAVVRLGRATDTYDRTGQTTAEADSSGISREKVQGALAAFEGEIDQRPPAYSALKRDGVPLYKLARAGQAVTAPIRKVHVHRLSMLSYDPPLLTLELECSKGTYVRSLAHDLGAALGVGGSLDELARLKVGPFDIGTAVDIETLRAEFASGAWADRVMSPDEVLLDWPAAIVGPDNERRLRQGQLASLSPVREPSGRARAYSTEGDFVGVITAERGGVWRPAKVFQLTHGDPRIPPDASIG